MTTLFLPTTQSRLSAPRRWAALAVLMLPVLLVAVDNTVLSFAIPDRKSTRLNSSH